jgi:hypothetical protein
VCSSDFKEDDLENTVQMSEQMTEKLQQVIQRDVQRNDCDKVQRVKEKPQKQSIGQINLPQPESSGRQRNSKLPPLRASSAEATFSESMNFSDCMVQQAFFPDEVNGAFAQALAKNELSQEFSRMVNKRFTAAGDETRHDGTIETERVSPDGSRSRRGKRYRSVKPKKI